VEDDPSLRCGGLTFERCRFCSRADGRDKETSEGVGVGEAGERTEDGGSGGGGNAVAKELSAVAEEGSIRNS